ncbi:methyltransferase [Helicobacter trogontum]|uniref:methyltransferase n=1 Tax=Helicobacter trogontum TaxID=50960 RepID=UPI001F3EC917|nr:methyltransferase [Helicobacter trogontum]MDY5184970.1 methyltransferase [Helicobacter trogontum]
MAKNIQTHNAKVELVKKFLNYANIADASYALLHYIEQNAKDEKEVKADRLTFGDKLEQDIDVLGLDNKPTIKPKGTNTAYACAIEARFNEEKIGSLCIPLTNKCLTEKDKISNNDITQVKLDSKLSKRTITFTNRFRILAHQKNTSSGFSATLFEDTEDNNQKIFAIRGTEFKGL